MRYYLCGPIDTAGKREANITTFKEVTLQLRSVGFTIISPIEASPENAYEDYMQYIKADIAELVTCDAIILLPGWPQSKGARGELSIAMYLNMRIYYYNPDGVEHLIDMNF